MVGDRRIKLLQCRVEGSWWKLVDDAVLVGLIVVYVDDLLICSTPPIIKAVSEAVKALWATSSLSWASDAGIRFLGIEIAKVEGGFMLNQEPYIRELLRLHSIGPTQRSIIPVSREQARFEGEPDEAIFTTSELRRAQQLAGEVLWLSQRTRPDVAYTASLVSSLCSRAPRRAVAIALKCLEYLQHTMSYSIRVQTHGQSIVGWTDASFAPEGARSHTGWLVFIDETPVSWRSSRQSTVTLTTAASELAASVEGALALVSIEALLSELGLGQWTSCLKTDSTSSLAIQKGSGSWRTRHLRIKANWICERIESSSLTLEHCAGSIQLADALTKALSSQRLKDLAWQMGLRSYQFVAEEEAEQAYSNSGSSRAGAPNPKGFKVLVALMVWSQSVVHADASDLMSHEPMSVDYNLLMWCVFALVALLWTAAWELIKYAGWQLYFL